MIERMLYRSNQMEMKDNRNRAGQSLADPSFIAKHQIAIKLTLHIFLVIAFHVLLGFIIPISNADPMYENFSLSLMYFFCMAYLYTSAQ